ncbi:GlcNAc-binding protein A [Poriferisphaera corsica]|uniref:GlcNAc-binding protein A n=1 Tax=Poriferisphaera corsica TaxID=2528020 RepID=A0A517YVJ0_9BACT|nr:lytic polysaccharide monooxygenase auxiliary activity family 9 protein [Poriferisphaera corsica]QDU34243.1 GlcNAc-binding protein A [Poriferisphaera corsica]
MKLSLCITTALTLFATTTLAFGHGSAIDPASRVWRVRQSNPERPSFQLAQNAVNMDGKNAYYTWNQVSQNISAAVQAGLPEGFDYSPWVPDGQIASGGNRSYSGLDQVSDEWPTTPATAGETFSVDFHATAVHEPSVFDVWMTTEDWDPNTQLNWDQMEFLGRADTTLQNNHYYFDVDIPEDRSGHHVLWIAWQRNDPVGEVFFSTSDLMIAPSNVPEPASLALFGAIGIPALLRRRRKATIQA